MKGRMGMLLLIALLMVLGLVMGACNISVRGNPRESLTIETQITEAQLQQVIDQAIADPLIRNFAVDAREGYIFVTAERKRLYEDVIDTLTFRLDLGVGNGHLTAVISNPQINGYPVDEPRVDLWNQHIANILERLGRSTPNTTLQAVRIGNDVITLTWLYTAPSQPGS